MPEKNSEPDGGILTVSLGKTINWLFNFKEKIGLLFFSLSIVTNVFFDFSKNKKAILFASVNNNLSSLVHKILTEEVLILNKAKFL